MFCMRVCMFHMRFHMLYICVLWVYMGPGPYGPGPGPLRFDAETSINARPGKHDMSHLENQRCRVFVCVFIHCVYACGCGYLFAVATSRSPTSHLPSVTRCSEDHTATADQNGAGGWAVSSSVAVPSIVVEEGGSHGGGVCHRPLQEYVYLVS